MRKLSYESKFNGAAVDISSCSSKEITGFPLNCCTSSIHGEDNDAELLEKSPVKDFLFHGSSPSAAMVDGRRQDQ